MDRQSLSRNFLPSRGRWRSETFLSIASFLVGISLFFRVDKIPGNLGDARLNMYVLEHGYRWLTHLDHSFWSAPFFYPAPNVITYSDNHLGSFLFYSVFRTLGASRETAFQLWVITIFVLNYFITWLVLKAQKFHPIGAIASAYLFTFPMIMAGQMGHAQLAPRFMVPVAFWMAYLFLECGKPRMLWLLLAACAYQIYLNVYIGYFLVLSLGPFCVALFLYRKQWTAIRPFIENVGIRVALRRSAAYAGSCIGMILVLLPLVIPYYHTQQELGGRSWEEVVQMLPRWQSYLYAPDSIVWGKLLHFGDALPYRVEHQLFLGVLPFIGILIFLYLVLKRRLALPERQLGLAMITVLIALGVLTFCNQGDSIYHHFWAHLPGAGGIRAVTRIILVLVYPIAVVFGAIVTYSLNRLPVTRLNWMPAFIGLGILMLVVLDQAATVASIGKRHCKDRIAQLKAKINGTRRSVLWVCNHAPEGFIIEQLDAMLAAQDLGLNVVNGYSGLAPKEYPTQLWSLTGDVCAGIGIWTRLHPEAITNQNLLQVGQTCKVPDHDYLPTPTKGFSEIETAGETVHLWAVERSAELSVPEMPGSDSPEVLSFDVRTLKTRLLKISEPDGHVQTIGLLPGKPHHVDILISPPNKKTVIKLDTKTGGVKPGNGDPRILYFDVSNPHLKELSSEEPLSQ